MSENNLITEFTQRIIEQSDYTNEDAIYLGNQILGMIGESNYEHVTSVKMFLEVIYVTLLDNFQQLQQIMAHYRIEKSVIYTRA